MGKMIESVVSWMIRSEIIEENTREIYSFGLQQGLFYLLNILTFLVISIGMNAFWPILIFTISYLALRQYSGGYHSENKVSCYLLSTVMIVVVGLIINYHWVCSTFLLGGAMISTLIIWLFGPIEDHHKPLDTIEIKVYTKKMRLYLAVELGVLITIYFIRFTYFVQGIALGITAAGLMVVIGTLKNALRNVDDIA